MKSKQRANIEKVQKYCVRAIMNKPRNYHTDPLFKELKIMKIKELEHFESSKLAYCIKENLLPMTNNKNVSYLWKEKSSLQHKKQKTTQYQKTQKR